MRTKNLLTSQLREYQNLTGNINHLLTEKRVSKKYMLSENYAIPTFKYEWEVVEGYHEDTCESEECEGHPCYKRVSDGSLNFVVTNMSKVYNTIVGDVDVSQYAEKFVYRV